MTGPPVGSYGDRMALVRSCSIIKGYKKIIFLGDFPTAKLTRNWGLPQSHGIHYTREAIEADRAKTFGPRVIRSMHKKRGIPWGVETTLDSCAILWRIKNTQEYNKYLKRGGGLTRVRLSRIFHGWQKHGTANTLTESCDVVFCIIQACSTGYDIFLRNLRLSCVGMRGLQNAQNCRVWSNTRVISG